MSEAAFPRDWRDLNLELGGRSLIEASAGTGKTWTIAVLYLRLLLEQGLGPRQVVVTTFTDAAASELRERLRERLRWAEDQALHFDAAVPRDAEASTDILWLHDRWLADVDQREHDLQRLRLALSELDRAPISTLHGLCARILAEHPFAAGGRFVQGELVDGAAWMAEIAADLRRSLTQGNAEELNAWLPPEVRAHMTKPPDARQISRLLAPGTEVPLIDPPDWPDAQVVEALRAGTRPGLFKKGSLQPQAWDAAATFIETRGATPIEDKLLKVLRLDEGPKGLLKGSDDDDGLARAVAASPRVAAFVESLQSSGQQQLWHRIREWALLQKARQAERHDQRSFDDLLSSVQSALQAEQGQAVRPLADALYAAWPVALVDEFQDTDGVQYGILDAIYRDAEGAPRGRLVMIGDPKQAIYRFRGGDIHSYQRAAESADASGHLRLDTNQRSASGLVEAVNQFFAATGPSLDAGTASGIAYHEVKASGRRDTTPLRVLGETLSQPLVVHYREDAPELQETRIDDALMACANDIAVMLSAGDIVIGEHPVGPADIAVLLPTHGQIQRMRRLLEMRGVPCVSRSRSSVFMGETARDLQLILHAVDNPGRAALIRAALASPLWGMSLQVIGALDEDPQAMQAMSALFHRWQASWQARGVQTVVDGVVEELGPRLLATSGGERILTDLRHIGEELQAQVEAGLGPQALLAWLAAQRAGETDGEETASESRQLRIESEASRVQLMTLHASKGLEFPIVFLPLMWAHGERREDDFVVLNEPGTGVRQLRTDEAARQQATREMQDERFRVLYVALTRAIHACHVYALPPHRNKAYGGTRSTALDALLARLTQAPPSSELMEATPNIEWEMGWTHDRFVRHVHVEEERPRGKARDMPPARRSPLPSRHSFSTLTRGLPAADGSQASAASDEALDALLDVAPNEVQGPSEHPVLLALQDVRGTGIGNAIHTIFEYRQIGMPVREQPQLLRQSLRENGLWQGDAAGQSLARRVAERIDMSLATPLGDDMPALGTLPAADLRAEMGFHFALDETSLQVLQQACEAQGEPRLVPQGSRRLTGLMTGKIDLLFRVDGRIHVLDYKGNFLGTRIEDYLGPSLVDAMDHSHYRFQALLYTVALERHLRLRLPRYERARHLGDAWYLFVRGVGLAPGAGIWRHRFADGLLDAVDAALPGVTVEVAA
ncbi:MAG: UvrD-helicase domain-containing protein [Xanthomonadaceae bacterium]|nr:UvrD-helicase domain-containing protein [Xanthomonadaceae bacterium]